MATNWGAQRWLRMTKENTWSVFDGTGSTPTVSTSVSIWIRLLEDAFVLDGDPHRWQVFSADGGNLLTQAGTGRTGFTGKLRTLLYPTQAQYLVPWFATPAGSGSAKALPSWTIDYWNGFQVVRTLGVRPMKGTIKSDDSDGGYLAMLDLDLVGKSQVSDGSLTLAEPASSVFPTERPYQHSDLAGLISIASSSVSAFKSLSITYANILYTRFHEFSTVDRINYRGRRVTVDAELEALSDARRATFEAQTAQALQLGWGVSTPHSVTFNLQGQNYMSKRTVSTKLGEDTYDALSFDASKDPSTGVDAAVTVV